MLLTLLDDDDDDDDDDDGDDGDDDDDDDDGDGDDDDGILWWCWLMIGGLAIGDDVVKHDPIRIPCVLSCYHLASLKRAFRPAAVLDL